MPKTMALEFNQEMGAVLIRCLLAGRSAVSQDEVKSGKAQIVEHNADIMLSAVSRQLADSIITSQVALGPKF